MDALFDPSSWLLRLFEASWIGAAVILLVWLLTRAVQRTPAWLRAALWWLAALKLMLALVAIPAIELPLLPSGTTSQSALHQPTRDDAGALTIVSAAPPRDRTFAAANETSPAQRALQITLALWLLGAGCRLGLEFVRHRRLRRQLQQSPPRRAAALTMRAQALAHTMGMRSLPQIELRELAPAPLATGLITPRVILPAHALTDWSEEQIDIALAHELAHHQHRDLWLSWIPLVAETLFWFHPLARLTAREYAAAREEACDAAALAATGVSPAAYGRWLLQLPPATPPPAALVAGARSLRFRYLKRRIKMLETGLHLTARPARWLSVGLMAFALMALVPWRVVAQPVPAAPPAPAAPQTKRAVAVHAPARAPLPPPVPMDGPLPPLPASPPSFGAEPGTPMAPAAATSPSVDTADDLAWVVVLSGDNVEMSGSMDDYRAARRAGDAERLAPPFLWIRSGAKTYITQEQAAIDEVRSAMSLLTDRTAIESTGAGDSIASEDEAPEAIIAELEHAKVDAIEASIDRLRHQLTQVESARSDLAERQRLLSEARAELERLSAQLAGARADHLASAGGHGALAQLDELRARELAHAAEMAGEQESIARATAEAAAELEAAQRASERRLEDAQRTVRQTVRDVLRFAREIDKRRSNHR